MTTSVIINLHMFLKIPHNSLITREKEKLDGDLSVVRSLPDMFVPSGIFEQKNKQNVNEEYNR